MEKALKKKSGRMVSSFNERSDPECKGGDRGRWKTAATDLLLKGDSFDNQLGDNCSSVHARHVKL